MKLFIDSSDIDEIREALRYGVSGVTTNPTTMAKAGVSIEERIEAICRLPGIGGVEFPVSAQVTESDATRMAGQAAGFLKISPNVMVKLPASEEGLRCCGLLNFTLTACHVNVTLIFSPTQALIAAQNGAWCVSPFLCRWRDQRAVQYKHPVIPPEIRRQGVDFLRSIINAVKGTDCRVLAASIRSPEDVEDAIEAGCDIATVSLKVLKQMMAHPKTDEGLAKFMVDWKAGQK